MDDLKENYTLKETNPGVSLSPQFIDHHEASNDEKDMYRLGRKQELKRRFNFLTITAFIVALGLTWEYAFTTIVFGLANGGTAGAIWLTVAVCCGMLCTMLSMAECASMAPTSGGQYHWVSEFAPPKYQKFLSYCVGWLCTIGWQTGLPGTAYLATLQVVALISVCNPTYQSQGWQAALITIGFAMFAICYNIFAIRLLPLLELVAAVIHAVSFFAFIIILWVMGPKNNPHEVFFQFEDQNNWGSLGLAAMVGMIGPAITFVGGDAAVHLSEEVENASYSLPRAIVTASLINYVTGFVAVVTLVSNLSNLEAVINTPTGQPWVAIMYNVTGSRTATIVLVSVMIFLFFTCVIGTATTSSRQVFAFSRDRGLPFHGFISRVNKNGVPVNSIYVTIAFTCLVAIIIIGSSVAFDILLSVSGVALYASYIVVIGCLVSMRFSSRSFPPSKFSLGKFGLPLNILAIMFLSITTVFIFFPSTPNPAPASMNWNCLIFGVLVIVAIGWYFYRGRHEYLGPVTLVRAGGFEVYTVPHQSNRESI